MTERDEIARAILRAFGDTERAIDAIQRDNSWPWESVTKAADAILAILAPTSDVGGREEIARIVRLAMMDEPSDIRDAAVRQERRAQTAEHYAAKILALRSPTSDVGGGWRPIETAPKDGTPVLTYNVLRSPRGAINVCWWSRYYRDEEGWLDDQASEPDPTHWRPLPDPPDASAPPSPADPVTGADGSDAVWRVCHVITGDCKRCPATEVVSGDTCVRGCYLRAEETVNVVETGNPWRKTSGVRSPWAALSAPPPSDARPLDLVLFCPACGLQHIDEPSAPRQVPVYGMPRNELIGYQSVVDWTNPPHRSHLCAGCGHIWRPADVPTNGVAAAITAGKSDSPLATPMKAPPPSDGVREALERLNAWLARGNPSGGMAVSGRDGTPSIVGDIRTVLAALQTTPGRGTSGAEGAGAGKTEGGGA